MSEYLPKLKSLGANVKVELDLSNYVLNAGFKKCNRFHISDFAKKADLANLKPDVDKLDIDNFKNALSNINNLKSKVDKLTVYKLVPLPDHLSKLSGDVKKNTHKFYNITNLFAKIYSSFRASLLIVKNVYN